MDISNWYNFDCEPSVSSGIICEMGFGPDYDGTQCIRCSDFGYDVHYTRPGECLIRCPERTWRNLVTGSCNWTCPSGSAHSKAIGMCNVIGTNEQIPALPLTDAPQPQPETPTTNPPTTPPAPTTPTTPTIPTPTTPMPATSTPPTGSTVIPQGEQAVRDYFSGYGIEINNDNACQAGQTSGCTTIAGLRGDTVNGVVSLKQGCGDECNVTITGGTEGNNIHVSGEYSHVNGYKVDLRPNAELNDYIETKYDRIPEPRSDGAIGYLDPSGNTYYYEKGTTTQGPHWDVTYLGT